MAGKKKRRKRGTGKGNCPELKRYPPNQQGGKECGG